MKFQPTCSREKVKFSVGANIKSLKRFSTELKRACEGLAAMLVPQGTNDILLFKFHQHARRDQERRVGGVARATAPGPR